MLFAVKNHLGPTLLLAACLAGLAVLARATLDLEWRLAPRGEDVLALLVGGGAIAASDATLHGLLWLAFGQSYLIRYRALVDFFRPQGLPQILASGALAASEELVFRGVLLEGLRPKVGLPDSLAIGIAALCFGLCHLIPRQKLWSFTLWAIWEGGLLGAIYVLSDSLLVSLVVHALHDVVGFSLFAWQRQTGRGLVSLTA